jgi:hypothetical protein
MPYISHRIESDRERGRNGSCWGPKRIARCIILDSKSSIGHRTEGRGRRVRTEGDGMERQRRSSIKVSDPLRWKKITHPSRTAVRQRSCTAVSGTEHLPSDRKTKTGVLSWGSIKIKELYELNQVTNLSVLQFCSITV